MIVDLIIAVFFAYLGFIFFCLNFAVAKEVTEENTIVGLFTLPFVAYCFLFASSSGFISIIEAILIQFPYVFLAYAGYKTCRKAISIIEASKINEIEKSKIKASKIKFQTLFIYVNFIFLFSSFVTLLFAFFIKSNLLISLIHVYIPIYLTINLVSIIYYSLKAGCFSFLGLFLNYATISFSIGLYEFLDFFTIVCSYSSYNEWGKFYPDPTHTFDIFWILGNAIILAISRILNVFKKK